MIASLYAFAPHDEYTKGKKVDIEEGFIRHTILNSIRYNKKKFEKKYGEIILCCDADFGNYWRKKEFKHYKANRKKSKEDSPFDWGVVGPFLIKIKDELREFSPYKVIHVDGAEADDVIGILSKIISEKEPILIVSADKDFLQLQRYRNVNQFSPARDKLISVDDPLIYLKEHIMRGDSGDGIPNFLSSEDTFVASKRQKPLAAKKVDKWINNPPESFCNDFMLNRYKTNEKMIDLSFTPESISAKIVEEYEKEPQGNLSILANYLMRYNMKQLLNRIEDFRI